MQINIYVLVIHVTWKNESGKTLASQKVLQRGAKYSGYKLDASLWICVVSRHSE